MPPVALPVPHEIFIRILELLEIVDLLGCRQLCHFTKDMVDTEAALQYRIALATVNMQDGTSVLPIAERLQLLNEHQAAWARLDWTQLENKIDITELDDDLRWDLRGNVFARHIGRGRLEFTPLSGTIREVPPRSLWETVTGFDIQDFAFDPDQDLLIALEAIDIQDAVATTRIHFLSMETGGPHPRSTVPCLDLCAGGNLEPNVASDSIINDFFGVLLQGQEEPKGEVRIYNWQTGRLHLLLAHPQLTDFAFFDEQHVLISFRSHLVGVEEVEAPITPAIQVFAFVDGAGRPLFDDPGPHAPDYRRGIYHGIYRGALSLPRTHPHSPIYELIFHGNSLATSHSHGIGTEPFRTSQDRGDRLFVIEMDIDSLDGIDCQVSLIVPHRTFQRHMSSMLASTGPLEIPWADWGPNGSRLFFGEVVDGTWTCPTYGSRFVSSRAWPTRSGEDGPGNYSLSIEIYDFGHLAVQKGIAHGHPADGWFYENEPEDVEDHQRFRCDFDKVSDYFVDDDISTRLPFRWTSSSWDQPLEHNDTHATMLAEDNILLVCMEDAEDYHITLLNF